MHTAPRPRFRRSLIAVVVVLAGVGPAAWSAATHDARPSGGDTMTAPTSSRSPVDGVTPTATGRTADVAPSGRTRSRWIGDVLAALALVALWTPSVRCWAVRQRARGSIARRPQRPALGRAPPAFG